MVIVVLAILCIGFFIDIFLPFSSNPEFSEGGDVLLSALFFVLFAGSGALLLRIWRRLRIMSGTYYEVASHKARATSATV